MLFVLLVSIILIFYIFVKNIKRNKSKAVNLIPNTKPSHSTLFKIGRFITISALLFLIIVIYLFALPKVFPSFIDTFRDFGLISKTKEQIESDILQSVKTKLAGEGVSCYPTSVSLTKSGQNQYKGIVHFSSNDDLGISVSIDKDSYYWEIENSGYLKIKCQLFVL